MTTRLAAVMETSAIHRTGEGGVEGCGERGRVSPRFYDLSPTFNGPMRPLSIPPKYLSQMCAACWPGLLDTVRLLNTDPSLASRVRHTGLLSLCCYSAAKASNSLGKIWEYFVMPTMVNTFVKCCDKPNVDTFCPEFEASISIWIISAIPLELM